MSENNEKINMDDDNVKTMLFTLGRLDELVKLGLVDPSQKLSDKGSAAYVDLRLTEFEPEKNKIVSIIAELFGFNESSPYEDKRILYILSETIFDTTVESMAEKFKEVADRC